MPYSLLKSVKGKGFSPFPISNVKAGFWNFSINQSLSPAPSAISVGAEIVYPEVFDSSLAIVGLSFGVCSPKL